MKRVCIFSVLLGLAQICAAVLHLEDVTTVAQCNFLARVTIVGILCVGLGLLYLAQTVVLEKIRGRKDD